VLLLPIGAPAALPTTTATAPATAAEPSAPIDVGAEIAAFYRARAYQPLWVAGEALRPEALQLIRMLREEGPIEPALGAAIASARSGDPHALTRADLLLSRAYADYHAARQRPPRDNRMNYIDAGLAPAPRPAGETLAAAAAAPSLSGHLAAVERINPVYAGLKQGLATYRQLWSRLPQLELPAAAPGPLLRRRLGLAEAAPEAELAVRLREFQAVHGLSRSGRMDPATRAALNAGAGHYERLILANMERARAIPARPDGRYLLVDSGSAQLWMVEGGRIQGRMRVIVGKRAMPTPVMAGLIRYAALNPYWNLPPDLIRERARGALRRGPGAITAERLEVLSDWSPQARRLDPRQVDWRAVAAGRRFVQLRQTPGPANMMGRIKFMMPNDLGIYLHDTPLRQLFAGADRRHSSGCVRLEDAPRLARWLFGGTAPRPNGAPEQRVDLPEAVPVYIAYFTALPARDGGVVFQNDVYGRDRGAAAPPRSTPRRNRMSPAK
jgi:murein L,D-transpeptidase YcbB/YkuD